MTERFYSHAYRSELSRQNRLGRLLWGLCWVLFFRPSPRIAFGWRRWLLRAFGARIASTATVYPSARIWAPWNLEMGQEAAIGDFVDCYCVDQVVIASEAIVSQYAFLCTAAHDIESPTKALITKPIHIGRGAWVFADAFVGMGVNIGEGAIVAARSVVVKDVAPFMVVAGNPARVKKRRAADWLKRESQ